MDTNFGVEISQITSVLSSHTFVLLPCYWLCKGKLRIAKICFIKFGQFGSNVSIRNTNSQMAVNKTNVPCNGLLKETASEAETCVSQSECVKISCSLSTRYWGSRWKIPHNFNPIMRCVSGKLQALPLSSGKKIFVLVRQATDRAPEPI
jgi:hypothetical protein